MASLRLLLSFLILPLCAQTAKLLDTDTFFEMESLASPAISADGSQIAFSRSWADKGKDRQRSNIWLVDKDGQRLRQLTNGGWRDSEPVWSPDSKRIAFLSDRDGTTQLYTMWMDTREVAQLTHLERAPGGFKWSPDGKQLAFTARVPDVEPILPIKMPRRPEGAEWAKPVTVIDRLSWRADGTGPIERGFTHVFVVDASTGGTPRQLTTGKYNHTAFNWSADGKTVFVAGIRKPDAEYLRGDSEIYAITTATGELRTLTDRKGPDREPVPSPNPA